MHTKKNNRVNENNIDAIIFDLGQVIVEVNHEKTYHALEIICDIPKDEIKNIFKRDDYFQFELGKISNQEFLSNIKSFLRVENRDIASIEEAWDAMIIGVPSESILLLKMLKNKFPLFALSNTNSCHVNAINRHLKNKHHIHDVKELFDNVYYSHELGLGKPDKEIFEYVLNDTKLFSKNILFIDDNLENIQTSKELGFQTIHLSEQKNLAEELKRAGVLDSLVDISNQHRSE
jgi:HAD superfamily hydrolase (TIGR01549 family)